MKRFRVTATATVEVVTFVEAPSYKQAEKIAADRDVDLCIHGSEIIGEQNEEEFVLVDGSCMGVDHVCAEEEEP